MHYFCLVYYLLSLQLEKYFLLVFVSLLECQCKFAPWPNVPLKINSLGLEARSSTRRILADNPGDSWRCFPPSWAHAASQTRFEAHQQSWNRYTRISAGRACGHALSNTYQIIWDIEN